MLDFINLQFTALQVMTDKVSPPTQNTNSGRHMPRTPLILELGTGSALQLGIYTKAAIRAVQDALRHNSINLAELFDREKSDMQIDVEIASRKLEKVDINAISMGFPYGKVSARSVKGGLDIVHPTRPDGPRTIIAHAAIIVSLNLIKKEA